MSGFEIVNQSLILSSFWKWGAVEAFFYFEWGLYSDTDVISVCQKQVFENFE